MIKFVSSMPEGDLYGFALTEGNLNRLEFNQEVIFFDFGYAGHPTLFGMIAYLPHYPTALDMLADIDSITGMALDVASDISEVVTPATLRFFPFAHEVMQRFRSTPFWAFDTSISIAKPGDRQMFFSGRTEQDIEEYFARHGFIGPETKRMAQGFGTPHK